MHNRFRNLLQNNQKRIIQRVRRTGASLMMGGILMGALPGGPPTDRPWYRQAPLWKNAAGTASVDRGDTEVSSNGIRFRHPLIVPFGLTRFGTESAPAVGDLDGDGDVDVLIGVFNGTTQYFENTGTATNPAFAPPDTNLLGTSDVGYRNSPAFADLDGDGDLDIFIGDEFGTTQYFENTGTTTAPAFASASANPFGLTTIASELGFGYTAPTFADLDGDGDLDAMIGEVYGTTRFFENTGTSTSPAFTPMVTEPFGLSDIGVRSAPAFADLDGDGDLDAYIGEKYGNIEFFENTGTATNPAFAPVASNPFGLTDVGYYSTPAFADLDGDGDLDLLVGNDFGTIPFLENTGTNTSPAFAESHANPFGIDRVSNFGSPTLADIDGDGDLDVLVGDFDGNTQFFENTGTANNPAFAAPVADPFGLTDVGLFNKPAFADLDGDGDLDAFIGEMEGTTQYFENTGAATNPAFATAVTNPFGLTDVDQRSVPTFADLDGDGDLDAFIGNNYGLTQYFENTGSVTAPAFASVVTNPFGITDVGYFSTPTFADFDGDGDLDAFIGENYGTILFFDNTGGPSAPSFSSAVADPFGLTDVGHSSTPTFADIDGDGDLDAFVGNQYGLIWYFESLPVTGVARERTVALPKILALAQNYPNPFARSTEIVYSLPTPEPVRLLVFDVQGREVARLVDGMQTAGEHWLSWNAEGQPSGLYVYRLETRDAVETRTMMLVR